MTRASTVIIGKSLGHRSRQATAVYVRLSLDSVRRSAEQANAAMIAFDDATHDAEAAPGAS